MMMIMAQKHDGIDVECENCRYDWNYSGEMFRATCPRCGKKTPTGLREEFEFAE